MEGDSLIVSVSPHEGSYVPWWKNLRFEIYGWKPTAMSVAVNGKEQSVTSESLSHAFAVTVPDDIHGLELHLR
jgi:alpha-glucosidase